MFYIESKGKKHYYNSIDDALNTANKIFQATGIVVGIFRTEED